MQQILVPAFPAITTGIIVFFVGAFLTLKVGFLRNYSIPESVSGGVSAALVIWALFRWFQIEVQFDLVVRETLLVFFCNNRTERTVL